MSILPSGTVSFLFTDVEGSTRLLERFGPRLTAAMTRHHVLLAEVIAANTGVVFETVGDAVYGAFAHPADAVAAAVAAQAAMAGEDWSVLGDLRIRVALHLGPVELLGAHYVGHPLFRCARILAMAHGGQTLLSTAMSDAVREQLPPGASLRGLGRHRLKDLVEPEDIWQLDDVALPRAFPPLRAVDMRFDHLPSPASSFVGRERELAAAGELLREHRLVTIMGPGGIGKTRLAIELASRSRDEHPSGTFFVALAPVRDPEQVPGTVVQAVGARLDGRSPRDALADHFRGPPSLLLLDNLEQVLGASAFIGDLLEAAPALRILATSRSRLRVRGEQSFRLEPLTEDAAVTLFRRRAAEAEGIAEDGPAIREICRRLDDLPLAIELAAARTRLLSLEQLRVRLAARAELSSGARDADPRHESLRATIAWSHDLLDPEDQRALRRLGVFTGPVTVDVAERVTGSTAATFASLLDQSLIRRVIGADGAPRLGMLETIREFAVERLEVAGERAEVGDSHASWIIDLVGQSRPTSSSGGASEWFERFDLEVAEIRAALRRTLDAGRRVDALRICRGLVDFWQVRDRFAEGDEWMTQALASPERDDRPTPPELVSELLEKDAFFAMMVNDLGRARDLAVRALATVPAGADSRLVSSALTTLGGVDLAQGDVEAATRRTLEALDIAVKAGDLVKERDSRHNLGDIERESGRDVGGRASLARSIALSRALAQHEFEAASTHSLADLELDSGDLDAAEAGYRRALVLGQAAGVRGQTMLCIAGLATIAARRGDVTRAARLWAAFIGWERSRGMQVLDVERRRYARWLEPVAGVELDTTGVSRGPHGSEVEEDDLRAIIEEELARTSGQEP